MSSQEDLQGSGSNFLDEMFPDGPPQHLLGGGAATTPPTAPPSPDVPSNWILHTVDNPLFPPLSAIPDAIRQVRDMSIDVSDAVEHHAKMLQDILSAQQKSGSTTRSSSADSSTDLTAEGVRLEAKEDGEIMADVQSARPVSADSALASLNKSVEKLLRNQVLMLNDMKKLQSRQEAFEKNVTTTKNKLEQKTRQLEIKLDFLGRDHNDRYLKNIHEVVMGHVNFAGHSADIAALWEGLAKLEQAQGIKVGNLNNPLASQNKRLLNINLNHAHWWRSKILNTTHFQSYFQEQHVRQALVSLDGIAAALGGVQPKRDPNGQEADHPVGGLLRDSLYKCASIVSRGLHAVLSTSNFGFLRGDQGLSRGRSASAERSTRMDVEPQPGTKRTSDTASRDVFEREAFGRQMTLVKRPRITPTPESSRERTMHGARLSAVRAAPRRHEAGEGDYYRPRIGDRIDRNARVEREPRNAPPPPTTRPSRELPATKPESSGGSGERRPRSRTPRGVTGSTKPVVKFPPQAYPEPQATFEKTNLMKSTRTHLAPLLSSSASAPNRSTPSRGVGKLLPKEQSHETKSF
ncbi:hypothetical protein NA57DRAFT_79873 [Rhizodiscina lignyota]|uniref:Uncharacterized protein n=1 Tax=Rhizodiscina lignyota TaxID=1504668 RepID=A0A9P4I7R5_9PEZI|nr:hypothetical protein NA57DRAFT_79873 [Rhizodiscina lignyota]